MDELFNKLQIKLLLDSAEQQSIPPDNDFCITWIDCNSENLRTFWNQLSCKTCKFNTKCTYIYELLKREIDGVKKGSKNL